MSTYGSLKSNWHAIKVSTAAHSDCPLVLCSAKHSFVKVAARRTVHLQQCSLRQLRLYHYYSSKNLWVPPFPYASPLYPFILPYVSFASIIHFPCASLFIFYLCVCQSHCPPSIVLLRLFSFNSLYNKPLLSLYHSGPPASFLLLFLPGFVVCINVSL